MFPSVIRRPFRGRKAIARLFLVCCFVADCLRYGLLKRSTVTFFPVQLVSSTKSSLCPPAVRPLNYSVYSPGKYRKLNQPKSVQLSLF